LFVFAQLHEEFFVLQQNRYLLVVEFALRNLRSGQTVSASSVFLLVMGVGVNSEDPVGKRSAPSRGPNFLKNIYLLRVVYYVYLYFNA